MSPGRRPVLLLAPLVWLAVVLVVAAVTWRVIDSAGRQVLVSGEPPPLSASGTTEQAGGGSRPPSSDPADGRTRRQREAEPSNRPKGSGGGGPAPAGGPTPAPPLPSQLPDQPQPGQQTEQQPGQQTGHGPTQQTDPPPSEQPDPEPTQQPSPQTQVRSWQGAAGTVTAACTGDRISLQSVTPSDGWGVEVGDRGPEHIEVTFRTGGEDERETRVKAECSGGAPRFAVEVDDD